MYVYKFYYGFHAFFPNLGSHNNVVKWKTFFFLACFRRTSYVQNLARVKLKYKPRSELGTFTYFVVVVIVRSFTHMILFLFRKNEPVEWPQVQPTPCSLKKKKKKHLISGPLSVKERVEFHILL